MDKREIKKWIIENASTKNGTIDLSWMDFGDRDVLLCGIKTTGTINNGRQRAGNVIFNNFQISADRISNYCQRAAKTIENYTQISNNIDNQNQRAKIKIYNGFQEADEIRNSSQTAKTYIYNHFQRAKKGVFK